MISVRVTRITVPPMSTLGYGYGVNVATGESITFCEGHRYMRHLGEDLQQQFRETGEPPILEIEDWMLLPS